MSTRNEYNAQYSPNGLRLAFESNRSGFPEVWVSDVSGSNAMPVTHFQGPVTGSPSWSFDGKWIAFDTRVKGRPAIFVMTADGKAMRRITEDASPNVVPSWSHDGRWIYFASKRAGSQQIWRIHPDGTGAEQITRQGGFAAQETANGKYIYYTKTRDSITSLWRARAEGGMETEVAASVLDRMFAVSSRGVYFGTASDPRSSAVLYFRPFKSATPILVTSLSKAPVYRLTISPDEHQLIWGQVDSSGTDLVIANYRFK